jgi:hypothetical protein
MFQDVRITGVNIFTNDLIWLPSFALILCRALRAKAGIVDDA